MLKPNKPRGYPLWRLISWEIIELLFSLFIHQVLSCNDFSVVLFLFIVYWVGRLKLKTKSEAPMQNFWSLFDIMLSTVHVNTTTLGVHLR